MFKITSDMIYGEVIQLTYALLTSFMDAKEPVGQEEIS